MGYQIIVKSRVQKDLKRLPRADNLKILSAFTILSQDPYLGKKLHGKLGNYYSYRVWPYRILYEIIQKSLIVFIFRVGHRQGVY